jgi:hypothetical protein
MRKVTRQIIQAWARGDSLTLGNTSTNGEAIWLHGNPIAWKTGDDDVIALTLCGWNTVTTRERLNGILHSRVPAIVSPNATGNPFYFLIAT